MHSPWTLKRPTQSPGVVPIVLSFSSRDGINNSTKSIWTSDETTPKISGDIKARGGTLEEAFTLQGSRGPIFFQAANSKVSNSTKESGSGGITSSNDSSSNKDHPENKKHYPLDKQSVMRYIKRSNAGRGDAQASGVGAETRVGIIRCRGGQERRLYSK